MTVYQDPQERVEAALVVAAGVMAEFERAVYQRVAAEYRAVNNNVSEAAILELVQAELYDRREAAARPAPALWGSQAEHVAQAVRIDDAEGGR